MMELGSDALLHIMVNINVELVCCLEQLKDKFGREENEVLSLRL
jgi:hypothetical protein